MTRTKIFKKLFFIMGITFYFSCSEWFMSSDPENTPINNFEILWNDFDEHYALFEVKNIDWDSLYTVYGPQISNDITDRELYDILTSMLRNLNDGHVQLITPFGTFFSHLGSDKFDSNFNLKNVKTAYLENDFSISGDGRITSGNIRSNIYYLHISSFGGGNGFKADSWSNDIDNVLSQIDPLGSLILDVRDNPGGNGINAYSIAGRFTDTTVLFLYTQTRNGPNHTDFTSLTKWYIEPEGPEPFTRPVVVLTNRLSGSAAEYFTLALSLFPHVTIIGDTTGGFFANNIYRELPNGWVYRISIQKVLSPEKICYEGIGLPPDIQVLISPSDSLSGRDTILERAIEFLE